MPHYYLRTRRPQMRSRCELREFPDLNTALAAANRKARSILRRCGARDALISGTVDIEDDGRLPLARVLFAEVQQRIS